MRSLSRVTAVAVLLSLTILTTSSRAQEGREIARNAFPSVVLVLAENPKTHRASLGSGFFIRDNLIVTNYHVIKGTSRISVKLVGHKDTYQAQVVASSIAKDLAFIRVIDIQAPPLSFGDLDEVAVGDQVYAIGNPEGLEATLSQGIVSGIRYIGGNRYFQISAAISHGSSGGPVLNKSGEVIGVAVGALKSGQNLNFAIPSSDVVGLINETAEIKTPADPAADISPGVTSKSESKLKLDSYVGGQINKAVDKVREHPNSLEAHFELAETYRKWSDYESLTDKTITDKAIQEYKRVIQMKPNYAPAYFGLAEIYHALNAETSITYYKQAVRINPDYVEAHVGLGTSYSDLKRYDEAIQAFKLAITLKSDAPEAYKRLASVYELLEEYSKAIVTLNELALIKDEAPDAYTKLGQIYARTGKYDEAIRYYNKAINTKWSASGGYEYFGLWEAYRASGRLPEGVENFKQLIVTEKRKVDSSDPLHTAEGNQLLKVENTRNLAWAHLSLGMMYVYLQDNASALNQYKAIKALGNDGMVVSHANQLLDAIYK